MSQTYVSIFIMFLAQVLPMFGFTIGSSELTTTVTTLVTLGSGLWVLVRRYQAGGVKLLGSRTQ